MPLVARRSISNRPTVVLDLDDRLDRGGFAISDDGLGFERSVRKGSATISVRVASRTENTVDSVELEVRADDADDLVSAMRTADAEGARLTRMAQLGYPGGAGGLWNVNQDEGLGGPRWWLYDQMSPDMTDLEKWIQSQFRYNPSYMMTPDAMPEETHYEPVATIEGEASAVRLVPDRQETVLEVKVGDKVTRVKMPSFGKSDSEGPKGELAQEVKKYALSIAHTGTGKSVIFLRKVDERGDNKGIWEINGRPSAGIAYIDEDGNSPSLHPELLDDRQWTQGIGPGVVGYIPKY